MVCHPPNSNIVVHEMCRNARRYKPILLVYGAQTIHFLLSLWILFEERFTVIRTLEDETSMRDSTRRKKNFKYNLKV